MEDSRCSDSGPEELRPVFSIFSRALDGDGVSVQSVGEGCIGTDAVSGIASDDGRAAGSSATLGGSPRLESDTCVAWESTVATRSTRVEGAIDSAQPMEFSKSNSSV